MKILQLILPFLLVTLFAEAQKVKIVADNVKPITGKRTLVTSLLPLFQMKVIQVAAMVEIGTDTTFTLAYYVNLPEMKSDQKPDTTNRETIIVLKSGNKVTGQYISTTEGMGFKVVSYKFMSDSFRQLIEESATAYSLNLYGATGEYPLDTKYQDNIKRVCQTLIEGLKK